VKGAKVLGRRKDYLGRSGVEITFGYDPSGIKFLLTLIVSPSTGNPLESDTVLENTVRTPDSEFLKLPSGTVVSRQIFLRRAIVNSDTALPGGGSQPFKPTSRP
jgi:hypothetical protein